MNRRENKTGPFEIMKLHEEKFLKELSDLVENYDKLTADQGLEKATSVFDSITKHFEHQDKLLEMEEEKLAMMKTEIASYEKIRTNILSSIHQLVLMHVDEPDFLERLGILLNQVKRLTLLDESRLYIKMKQFMTDHELKEAREEVIKDFIKA